MLPVRPKVVKLTRLLTSRAQKSFKRPKDLNARLCSVKRPFNSPTYASSPLPTPSISSPVRLLLSTLLHRVAQLTPSSHSRKTPRNRTSSHRLPRLIPPKTNPLFIIFPHLVLHFISLQSPLHLSLVHTWRVTPSQTLSSRWIPPSLPFLFHSFPLQQP